MAKRLFKSSVPKEKTDGAKRSKNGIYVKFCAFLLAFTAISSMAVIAFQMTPSAQVAVILKAKSQRDSSFSPVSNVLMNPAEDEETGKNFLAEAAQANTSKMHLKT